MNIKAKHIDAKWFLFEESIKRIYAISDKPATKYDENWVKLNDKTIQKLNINIEFLDTSTPHIYTYYPNNDDGFILPTVPVGIVESKRNGKLNLEVSLYSFPVFRFFSKNTNLDKFFKNYIKKSTNNNNVILDKKRNEPINSLLGRFLEFKSLTKEIENNFFYLGYSEETTYDNDINDIKLQFTSNNASFITPVGREEFADFIFYPDKVEIPKFFKGNIKRYVSKFGDYLTDDRYIEISNSGIFLREFGDAIVGIEIYGKRAEFLTYIAIQKLLKNQDSKYTIAKVVFPKFKEKEQIQILDNIFEETQEILGKSITNKYRILEKKSLYELLPEVRIDKNISLDAKLFKDWKWFENAFKALMKQKLI